MFDATDSMFQSKWPRSFAPSLGCHDTEMSGFHPELQTAVAVVVVWVCNQSAV